MHNDPLLQYTEFVTQLARLNRVPSAKKSFTVAPGIQQSSEFLSRINVIRCPRCPKNRPRRHRHHPPEPVLLPPAESDDWPMVSA